MRLGAGPAGGRSPAGLRVVRVDRAGRRAGRLRSTDEVRFETTGRDDCEPPPPPPGAVTPEEVFAALQRVGLAVTDPRPATVPTLDRAGAGLPACYAYGCLHQVRTDEVTVTVWPAADVARARLDRSPGDEVAGYAAAGWLGAVAAGALDPFDDVVLFEPVTTVHLSAHDHRTYQTAIGCRDTPDACLEAYRDRVEAAAATLQAGR